MRLPSAIHPIRVAPFAGRVSVRLNGLTIAQSDRALALEEAGHPRVYYLPRVDVRMEHFARTERRSVCPFKGIAAQYSISHDGGTRTTPPGPTNAPTPPCAKSPVISPFIPDRPRSRWSRTRTVPPRA